MKVEFQMARPKSTGLSLTHRGAKIKFGIHKATGQYQKMYKRRSLYLGTDPDGVLDQWIEKTGLVDDEENGTVEIDTDSLDVGGLCNLFLHTKKAAVDNCELSPATYRGYRDYCSRIIKFFGRKTPIANLKPSNFASLRADFAKAKPQKIGSKINKKATKKPLSLSGLKTKIRHTKVVFRFAVDEGYLVSVPWTKATFSAPTAKAITKQANTKPPKQATLAEIQAILAQCGTTWRALILLALNSGSGNMDCGLLRWDDIDADGWVEVARNKTQVERRFRLWPETREALRAVREHYADKGYDDGLVFHGRQGGTYIPKGKTNHVSRRFTELADKAGVRRVNLTFYSLRHTFQNVADESRDFPAVQYVMGHKGTSMSDNYRGQPSDERLEAVTGIVRTWLFGKRVAK